MGARRAVRAAATRPGWTPQRRQAAPSGHLRKLAEIDEMDCWGAEQIGELSDREFLVAGAALYLGEGHKTGTAVAMANTNPDIIRLFVTWVRRVFTLEESRWSGRLYLHQGLDVEASTEFWSELSGIPPSQF
jgi:hypothetical protein